MRLAPVMALLLCACAYPASMTQQGAAQGELYFPAAPAGATVILDGRPAGMAASFDGRVTLAVSPGTHRVVVTNSGSAIIDKVYVVEAGARIAVRND
jgi:hypothetical protein